MAKKEPIKVWDIFVRVFHWILVVSIIGQYLSAEESEAVHVNLGYFIIILVLARIAWGFIGTKHARFGDFLYGPAEIFDYLRGLFSGKPIHYTGHNPAGGLMIFLMLVTLLATTFTGLKTVAAHGRGHAAGTDISVLKSAYADKDGHEEHEGSKYHSDSFGRKGKEKFWKEIHEAMTGFMIFLIIVHIGGVLVSSWLHKENLTLSMITGKKSI